MSYNTELGANNTELQEILDTINELPQAGAGGGVTSWNDLEDKPFGEIGGDTLIWDGTYNPDELVADLLVRISDAVPTVSDLANGITIKVAGIDGETVTEDEIILSGEEVSELIQEDGFLAADAIFIIPYDNYVLATDGLGDIIFPKTGIYTLLFATSLTVTIPGYTGFGTIKKLDPKYLPDWNDWEDKPFGEVKGDTLTWDGSYNPDEIIAGILVRISDVVLTASDFANGVIVGTTLLGESVIISGADAMAGFREDGYGVIGELTVIVPHDGYDRGDLVFPKAGIYTSPELPDLTITIPNYKGFITVKKIDEKYLPKNIKGADGKDGYTPVKGTDYFTPTDINDIVNQVYAKVADGNEVEY